MKKFSKSLLIPFAFVTMISFAGCGGESGPRSMTEDVPLSEIEAYEKSLQEMEAEDAGVMDVDESRDREPANP